MGIPDTLPVPEKPVFRSKSNRTLQGTVDWFKIEKGVRQTCMMSPW